MSELLSKLPVRFPQVLAVSFCMICFWGLCAVFFVARHPIKDNHWIAGPDDDFAHLYQQSQRLSFQSDLAEREHIVLIGSSALRESIVSTGYLVEHMPEVDWDILAPGDLLPVEALQVVCSLPNDMRGVLFVEVSSRTLSTPKSATKQAVLKPRFPSQPFEFQLLLRKEGYTTGPGLGLLTFYTSRWDWTNPTQAPLNDWLFHQVDYFDVHNVDWETLEDKYIESHMSMSQYAADNVRLYQLIKENAPVNMNVVWVRSPRNFQWEQTLDARYPTLSKRAYLDALSVLEQSVDTPLVVLDEGLDRNDYLDHSHIVTKRGRQQATERLLDVVRSLKKGMP